MTGRFLTPGFRSMYNFQLFHCQVNQLDLTVKEQHNEMESRIQKLDNQLSKYEAEILQRTKQVDLSI